MQSVPSFEKNTATLGPAVSFLQFQELSSKDLLGRKMLWDKEMFIVPDLIGRKIQPDASAKSWNKAKGSLKTNSRAVL